MEAVAARISETLTIDEFKELPEGPPYYEYEHGEVIEMPRPHPWHNHIVIRLTSFLVDFVTQHRRGLVFADVEVQLGGNLVYAPDILYMSNECQDIFDRKTGRICGAPDLVVEVGAPSSAARDRFRKFNNYLSAGVKWYWIIDPDVLGIEEYHLVEQHYVRTATVAEGEVFHPGVFQELEIDLAAIVGPRL